MIKLEINNQTKTIVFRSKIKEAAKQVAKQLKIKKKYFVSVAFVKAAQIRQLNKKYRRKDKITDILSFEGEGNYLGEIVICAPRAKKQAKEFKHSFHCELQFLFVHGLLHLLGYEHKKLSQKKTMENIQQKIMEKLC